MYLIAKNYILCSLTFRQLSRNTCTQQPLALTPKNYISRTYEAFMIVVILHFQYFFKKCEIMKNYNLGQKCTKRLAELTNFNLFKFDLILNSISPRAPIQCFLLFILSARDRVIISPAKSIKSK